MRKLRAAVIGLGVGEQHIEGYQKHPACEVVALCDFSEGKLGKAREKYPDMRLTPCAEEVLDDPQIDVVSIASYDDYHYRQIQRAIKNNKHVFVEKPLCLDEKEAIQIRCLLKEKPYLRISSNLILRMCPRFQWLKKMVERGKLGELFYVEGDYNYGRLHKITQGWRGKIDSYSVIFGGAIHLVDLLLWLTGDSVVEVTACGNNIASRGSDFRKNDFVVSTLKFQSGLLGKVTANFGCIFPHFHGVSIYGTRATFLNGIQNALWFELCDEPRKARKVAMAYPGLHKGDLLYDFVESILKGSQPLVSQEDVFETLSVCFAMERATRQAKPVKVNYL